VNADVDAVAPDLAGVARLVASPGYRGWREMVKAAGGCSCPVRLSGSWTVRENGRGRPVAARRGDVFVPCGNRREGVCPACARRYAGDAFHLVRAGLVGGKGVPGTVTGHPRVFATLTAPGFGQVHGRRATPAGKTVPCPCGTRHHPDDPRLGRPLDPTSYDYVGAVLWQAHSGQLWHRFTIVLRRCLARAAGLTVRALTGVVRVSYGKVAEYQRRGLVHFHAVIRLDGPDGPDAPPPAWATPDLLDGAVRDAAAVVRLAAVRPDGTPVSLVWGKQIDVRQIRPADAGQVEDPSGQITDAHLAAYIAKYSTKGTGKSAAVDRPIRSQHDIDHLPALGVSAHHRRMIQTAWDLGGLPEYQDLNLRRWAHMLGFRGHFLTKSRAYSSTFRRLRAEQRDWRTAQTLQALGLEPDTVTVINDWHYAGPAYTTPAEHELAQAIGPQHDRRTP